MLKFCGCRACRSGRKTSRMSCMVTRTARRLRRETKVALRRGDESPARVIGVPYTD